MKISYNWLKEYLDVDWEPGRVAELLTGLGLEVEGIEKFESVKGGLKGVVAGKVLTCTKHPNADKLSLTTVDTGSGEPVQIVCGAPNVAEGQTVAVATVGTVLYDREGQTFKIKKGKIRGEESHGMICAEDELGLGDSHDGIMVLDEDIKPGTPLREIFTVEEDHIFDIGLTPNRSDAMSHFGVARDLRAGLIRHHVNLPLISPPVTHFNIDNHLFTVKVEVENRKLAPRYMGITIKDMKVAPSPAWLQNRLRSIGLKPINNVVDVTNFVLHELGQPLHAFDASAIKGQLIKVKTLPAGTPFVTLDGEERKLHEEDLMICDAHDTPLCIAGVYGGLHSGVSDSTTDMFLESAYFDPVSIRKTSKRHGLHTDASFRFERGVDVNAVDLALKRAASLIVELTGGKISSNIQEFYPEKIEDHQVVLHYDTINKIIPQIIPKEVIKEILISLDIKIISETNTALGLKIPSYRTDVYREADVIEEILRVYGYNNVEYPDQVHFSLVSGDSYDERFRRRISSFLTARGFYEMMSNSLTKEVYLSFDPAVDDANVVRLLNPLSADLSVMRFNMLFSVLESIAYNMNRKQFDLQFFEIGKTYARKGDGYDETTKLALATTGAYRRASWNHPRESAGFFYLKGIITALLDSLGINHLAEHPFEHPHFSEGISLRSGKDEIFRLGIVAPGIAEKFGIKRQVVFAEAVYDTLPALSQHHRPVFREIPKYPEVKRDLALLIDKEVPYSELYAAAFDTEKKLLKEVRLFDVYEGDKIPAGKKSYALGFILRDDNKTLKDKQIDKVMKRLLQVFENRFGAELRQ